MTANTTSIEDANLNALAVLPPPSRFDDHIYAIKARLDAERPGTPTSAFLGSSSFYLWDRMIEDLGSLDVRNLGFGGATIRSTRLYVPQLFETYRPARLFIQLGENDLVNDAMTAEQTFAELTELIAELRSLLGGIPFVLLSAKVSPARLAYGPLISAFNTLQQDHSRTDPALSYVDVSTCLLGPNALPAHRYFGPDRIHLNREGYARWAAILRDLVAR